MFAIALPFLGGIGAPELIFLLLIVLFSAIPYWFSWIILGKAGFNPWIALLVFLGGPGYLILLAILAFSEWPALRAVPVPAGSASLAPAPAPAGWLVDPTGRYESRYWDGARWTDAVSSSGVQAVDQL